jgi:hypothetical protein
LKPTPLAIAKRKVNPNSEAKEVGVVRDYGGVIFEREGGDTGIAHECSRHLSLSDNLGQIFPVARSRRYQTDGFHVKPLLNDSASLLGS